MLDIDSPGLQIRIPDLQGTKLTGSQTGIQQQQNDRFISLDGCSGHLEEGRQRAGRRAEAQLCHSA